MPSECPKHSVIALLIMKTARLCQLNVKGAPMSAIRNIEDIQIDCLGDQLTLPVKAFVAVDSVIVGTAERVIDVFA